MNKKRSVTLCRAAALFILSLILLLSLCACFFTTGEVGSREEIEAKIEELSGSDLGYSYVASYMEDYGISAFNKPKMRRAELYVYSYLLYELPPVYEIAESTAKLFLEHFYDEISLEDDGEVTDALLSCYMASLGDNYAVYRNPEAKDGYHTDMSGSFVGIGVTVEHTDEFTIKVISLVSGAAAERAGIKVDDLIIAVDGVSVAEAGYDKTVDSIRGEAGTSVEITVDRGGEILTLTAVREKIVEELISYSIDDDKIGYIKIARFDGLPDDEDSTSKQLAAALDFMNREGAVGLIFDLRGNPGGYLTSVVESLSNFVPENTPVVSYAYRDSPTTVLRSSGGVKVDLPMTVICNGKTASAGELFCAALRDWSKMGLVKAKIVGEKSFGKGVMQSEFDLPGGSIINFTTAYYNPPSGINYDGEGVKPDVPVEASKEGDAQLDAARSELINMINGDGVSLYLDGAFYAA